MEKELTWFKKEFIEAYQAYGENEAAQKMFLSAPGKVKAIDEFQKLALGSIDGEVIYNEFKR